MPCPVVRLSSPVMDRTPRHIADRHDGPGARTHDMFMHFPESREFGPGPGSGRQGTEPGHQDNVVEVSLPDQLQDPRVLDLSGKKGRDPFPSPRRSQIPVASESFISDIRPGAVTLKGVMHPPWEWKVLLVRNRIFFPGFREYAPDACCNTPGSRRRKTRKTGRPLTGLSQFRILSYPGNLVVGNGTGSTILQSRSLLIVIAPVGPVTLPVSPVAPVAIAIAIAPQPVGSV